MDAGEIGAGHSVTALYELKMQDGAPADGKIATIRMRWANPEDGEMTTEISHAFGMDGMSAEFETASPRFQLAAAVAEYAELLRESYWARDGSLDAVAEEAARIRRLLPDDLDAAEFATLTARAAQLSRE